MKINSMRSSAPKRRIKAFLFLLCLLTSSLAYSQIATITATDNNAAENPLDTGFFTVSLDVPNSSGSAITINYNIGGTATN